MKESFRIWFKLEVSLFSVPVALVAVLMLLILLKNDSSIEVILGFSSISISCFMVVFAVLNLMLYTFSNKNTKHPKLVMFCILYWLVNWLFVAGNITSIKSGLLSFGMLIPVGVVAHLIYLSKGYFNNAT